MVGTFCVPGLLSATPAGPGRVWQHRGGRPSALPREVAGLKIPDSDVAVKATSLAHEVCEPSLFNHCARTYAFAGLLGARQNLKVDLELLFLASILHDLGLTERYMGP